MTLPPRVRAEVQRILDAEARRLLDAQLDPDPTSAHPGQHPRSSHHGPHERPPAIQAESVPILRADDQRGAQAA